MTLAQRVQKLRAMTGFTQAEYASILGVTQAAISQIEAGKREGSLDLVHKIVNYHKISYDWLLGTSPAIDSAMKQWAIVVTQEIAALSPRAFLNCDLSWLNATTPDQQAKEANP